MRYFFHTEDGQCFPDEEGTELPNLHDACIEATKAFGEFMRVRPKDFWAHDALQLHVKDETGLVLFTMHLSVTLSAAMNGRHPKID